MSKFDSLWDYVQRSGEAALSLTFEEIHEITGMPIDHSFLSCKKELETRGYRVEKISMKNQTVMFRRVSSVQ